MNRNPVILTRPQQQQQKQQTKQAQTFRERPAVNSLSSTNATAAGPSNASDDLPYSQWAKLTADNGLVYLAHPRTGESKWLWSRHWDPASGKDYLVNTISGERSWVTKVNEHLCPLKATVPSNAQTNLSSATTSQTPLAKPSATTPVHVQPRNLPVNSNTAGPAASFGATLSNMNSQAQPGSRPVATATMTVPSHGVGKSPLGKAGSTGRPDQSSFSFSGSHARNRPANASSATTPSPPANIAKDVALTPGEVLMTLPGSGQTYALNTQTNTRRWLSSQPMTANSQSQINSGHPLNKNPNVSNAFQNASSNNTLPGNNAVRANAHANIHENTRANHGLAAREQAQHNSGGPTLPSQQRQNPGATYPTGSQRMPSSSSIQGAHQPTSSAHAALGGLRHGGDAQQQSTSANTNRPKTATPANPGEPEGGRQTVDAKMSELDDILHDVGRMTSGGKYDLSKLEQAVNVRVSNHTPNRSSKVASVVKDDDAEDDVDQRLLQLAELFTQNMLKVDAVDSDGNAAVRAKRKLVVNRLLSLVDKVEALRGALKALN